MVARARDRDVSFWKRRDPRAKTLFAIAVSFALAVAPGARALLVLPLAAVFLATAGLDRGRLLKVMLAVAVLWALSLLANAFLISGIRMGPELLGWARPTREGLIAGFDHGARLAALAFFSAWVVSTTEALDLAGSAEWTVRRWPALRQAAHRALLPVVLGLRMIPLFVEEARRILEVDRLRRGPRGKKRRVRRLARLAPVWMVTVVEKADALALALTLRGYRPGAERGFARSYRWGIWDWALAGTGLVVLVLLRPL
jgi:energy-coupling factor transport system permease protein